MKRKHQVSVIAHRGYNKKYPENTLLSFKKAIDAGADYVELDVRLTKDDEIVVIHDGNTIRTGDKGFKIEETALKTLKQVDMGEGEKIPTLQEVFDLCKGKIGVQIEIKAENMAQKVLDLIAENEMEDEVLLSSFKHKEMMDSKKINPDILCATLEPSGMSAVKAVFLKKTFIKKAYRIKADAVHPYHRYVNEKFCKIAHKFDILVNPWTVDRVSAWENLVKSGVDGIITNDPEGLIEYLEKL